MKALALKTIELVVDQVDVAVSAMTRPGDRAPVVFLHGFGSTKEDYADTARQETFARRGLLAYDAPGCGASTCADLGALSIDFLVATAESVLDSEGVDRFHLVGHSMGGLTALLLAERMPDRVLSLTDIEGNLAPEDCFLSRQVLTHPEETDEAFLEAFARRVARSAERSSALYATSVQHKVRPGAVPGIFSSMVELSDHGRLLERFLALPMATSFVHGEQSSALTYLPRLARAGVSLMEISHSGHWPMYANPVELWQRVAAFVEEADPR